MLIDPNSWAKDGAIALAEWSVSNDGKRLAYAVQDGGTDWRTIRVLDVNTGKVLGDEVKWARFTTIAWAKDGSGFFYARFPEPKQGAASQGNVENHAVYFHAIATPFSPLRCSLPPLIVDALMCPYRIGERVRALKLLRNCGQGMLLMWDRGLHSYRMVHATQNRGCQYLGRVPKNVKFPGERVLEDGSYLSWIAPDRKSKNKGGEKIQVWVIEYTIDSENGQQIN